MHLYSFSFILLSKFLLLCFFLNLSYPFFPLFPFFLISCCVGLFCGYFVILSHKKIKKKISYPLLSLYPLPLTLPLASSFLSSLVCSSSLYLFSLFSPNSLFSSLSLLFFIFLFLSPLFVFFHRYHFYTHIENRHT